MSQSVEKYSIISRFYEFVCKRKHVWCEHVSRDRKPCHCNFTLQYCAKVLGICFKTVPFFSFYISVSIDLVCMHFVCCWLISTNPSCHFEKHPHFIALFSKLLQSTVLTKCFRHEIKIDGFCWLPQLNAVLWKTHPLTMNTFFLSYF